MKIDISKYLGNYDIGYAEIETIEQLEDFIRRANQQAVEVNKTGQGNLLVEDEVYDKLVEKLREVAPDSPVLLELWDASMVEDTDRDSSKNYYLKEHPMKSITTIKDIALQGYQQFLTKVVDMGNIDILLEAKLNGHGIRVIYEKGKFVGAYSRARGTKGKDLTATLRQVLGKYNLLYIDALYDSAITELRGELIMNSKVFDDNRTVINAVSPLFAVASLSRESATDEERALLDFIPYRLYMLNSKGEEIVFDSREEEFMTLDALGFYENSPLLPFTKKNIDASMLAREDYPLSLTEKFKVFLDRLSEQTGFGYYTDGVVLEVNDTELFNSAGGDIKYDYGNVALKIGQWNQSAYSGYVQMIRWTIGKSKITPTAVVSDNPDDIQFDYEGQLYQGYDALNEVLDLENYKGDLWKLVANPKDLGVETANGSRVVKVPLYEPANLLLLGLEIGSELQFKFGGEAGVVPLTEDGKLITDL